MQIWKKYCEMENVGIVAGSILNLVPPCTYYRHMDYIDAYRGISRYLGNKRDRVLCQRYPCFPFDISNDINMRDS